LSQAASYGRSFFCCKSLARFHTQQRQDATSSDTSDARSVPHHPLHSAKVTLKKASKPHAATLTRCFVHAMFTSAMRHEALFHTRSAFARARVKSARICPLTEPLQPRPVHEKSV